MDPFFISARNGQASYFTAILLMIFIAQALKEIGIPTPGLSQSLLFFAGYQFVSGDPQLGIGIILSAYCGSICGACLIFFLFQLGGNIFREKMKRFVAIKPGTLGKAMDRIRDHSFISILVGRSIPGLMVPTSIGAGILGMRYKDFLLGVFFSVSLWIALLILLGAVFGHFTPRIELPPGWVFFVLGALLAVSILASFLLRRKGKQGANKNIGHEVAG
jgi:membrane protein DedA with SNARE-associated domain